MGTAWYHWLHTTRSRCVQSFNQKFLPCFNSSFFLPVSLPLTHPSPFFLLLDIFETEFFDSPGWPQTHHVAEAELNSCSSYLHLPIVGATGLSQHTYQVLLAFQLPVLFVPSLPVMTGHNGLLVPD